MSERRNYYEIIEKLSFDPIDINEKKIISAIEHWKANADRESHIEGSLTQKQAGSEADMYESIKKCLTNKETRKQEAEAMKNLQLQKLNEIIAFLKESDLEKELKVTNARLLILAKSLRLDRENTVKKAFISAGFEVVNIGTGSAYANIFLSNTMFDNIDLNFKKLNVLSHEDYPWLSKVNNLYALAAFYNKDESNIVGYQKKSADELRLFMEKASKDVAGRVDEVHHCLANLFNFGYMQIFKDDNTKYKYDNSLKLKQLDFLLKTLKNMPDGLKRDESVAERGIKKIQRYFPDYNIALGIYNKALNIVSEPYEPEKLYADCMCANCKSYTKISMVKNRNECKCAVCGADLFIECPNCNEMVLAGSEFCQACGCDLNEAKNIDKYCLLAENALTEKNIEEARKQLLAASKAMPGDKRVGVLEDELGSLIELSEEKLNEIKDLVIQKSYIKADKRLTAFITDFPEINVNEIRDKIEKAIKEADAMFDGVSSREDACNYCYDILDKVSDYDRVIEYLITKTPLAVNNFSVTVADGDKKVVLTWDYSSERGVTYNIVKKADKPPESIYDGIKLLSESNSNSLTDKNIENGIKYFYGIFVSRCGNSSRLSVSDGILVLSDIDMNTVRKVVGNKCCSFSWKAPANCTGVEITRSECNEDELVNSSVVAMNAENSFEESGLVNRVTYNYYFKCLYQNNGKIESSKGINVRVMPEVRPSVVKLCDTLILNDSVEVNLEYENGKELEKIVFYDLYDSADVECGNEYLYGDIGKYGTKLYVEEIGNTHTRYNIITKARKHYKIVVFSVKGIYALASNCVEFNNMEKCSIEENETTVTDDILSLRVKILERRNFTAIHYAIMTKANETDPDPWLKMTEVGKMKQMSYNEYKNEGVIRTEVPETNLYITVIGEYNINKRVIYTDPSTFMISNIINASVNYRVSWGLIDKKKKVKLILECDKNINLPEMVLCCNLQNHVPASIGSDGNMVLCELPAMAHYLANTKLQYKIADEDLVNVPHGSEIRLFVRNERVKNLEMIPKLSTLVTP